jgi:hypothetical protein
MTFLKHALSKLRALMTEPRPTRYLVFILLASWAWLGMTVIEEGIPIKRFLGVSFLTVVFLWSRYGIAIQDDLVATRKAARKSREKQEFLKTLALCFTLPILVMLWSDFWRGVAVLAIVSVGAILYWVVTPANRVKRRAKPD